MNESKFNISDLYDSAQRNINEKIEDVNKKIIKHKEKLNDPKGKMGFFDKMSANSSINSYRNKLHDFNELSQLMNRLYFLDSSKHELPSEVIQQINVLGSMLSVEERTELDKTINNTLRNANNRNKDNIKNTALSVQKLLNKLKLNDKPFIIFRGSKAIDNISYEKAVLNIRNELLNNLVSSHIFLPQDSKDVVLPIEEQILLSDIEKMINGGALDKNSNVKDIVNNFSQIKDSFIFREKYNAILLGISNTISEISNVKDFDIEPLVVSLKNLEQKYKKELEKANKFLSKFNFNDIKNQIKDNKDEKEKENRINNNIMTYQNLAYELEKVQCETPDNYQKISELKDKMRVLADSSGLTKSQLDLADTNGKAKYHTEVEDNKAKGEYAQYRINYEKELEKNVMTEIRDFAISKLKEEGAFDEEYEFKNGDVYSKPMDKNAMISKKMDELMKMADMSPIERGLYDLKRLGLISNDATALDLSSKQLEEIKNNYSDDAFRFVESYKTWKNRENMKPQANAIYKEYIQYKASLKDKKNGLSFSEYAKQIHNVEGLSDTMINEELIAEMREQSRGMTR